MNALAKLIIIFYVPVLAMCSSAQTQDTVQTQTYEARSSSVLSRAELDQLLAPIALYPDTVLSHVLIASTYPLEVVYAARWTRDHSDLDAEAAVAAVEYKNWDPSVRALVAFPQILQRMSDDLDWTQQLGDAFLADEALVMNAIQNLRQKAYASGSLNKMKHVNVQREKRVIIIEPAIERVVYIPYYDTRIVYGNWWWPHHPPRHWHHPHDHIYVSGFYWGPRAHLGLNFFSTSFHWHQHRVVYIDHRQHRRHLSRPYTSRKIVRHESARHWQHNPTHRRGVAYRDERIRERYGSHRTSVVELQKQRAHDRKFVESGHSTRRSDSASLNKREALSKRQSLDARAASVRERLNNSSHSEAKRVHLAEDQRKRSDRHDDSEHRGLTKHRDVVVGSDTNVDRHGGELRSHGDLKERLSNARTSTARHRTDSSRRIERSTEQKKINLQSRREQLREEKKRSSNAVPRRDQNANGEASAQRREIRRQNRVHSTPERERSRVHTTRRESERLRSRGREQIERR